MQGRLPGLPGERATISDWANHISIPDRAGNPHAVTRGGSEEVIGGAVYDRALFHD
jgi:hypothetical protein